ncbi:hypothetical protein E2C00_00975 [Streptomyces sp. WAC05374]|uniref:hypothetical protein n=1 Tax=Streptomyces sp. WAC05374 TaxID=2487420 RepID=UPI000F87646C|nr:hypothetical protein [Streptomyces sp. WAC05374]RST09735.1 hypothetical protein EF905_28730 [Streptomyces sp. WAC05374]TDF50122.1 hypothetical protein E2B92_00950 [Streptomyces sp. WAC05374]TDF57847.1 hypothetical protein E2C02_08740 [Streptomyces sp. WAC05374]TDF60376.1 hypothetical protein E2C00_00975 [Streptomyces sp. WAC05374]
MSRKTFVHAWPRLAERAALWWSVLYAGGAALAAVTGPAYGYALLGKATGAAAEWATAGLYAAAALLAYALPRRRNDAWPSWLARSVVALCLASGFAFLFSPVHLPAVLFGRNQPSMDWAAWANQGLAVAGAVLWACAALAHRRRARGLCAYCGGRAASVPGGARGAAGLVAVAALVPYTTLKTAWALGATAGYTGAGKPGMDPRYTSDLGIRLYEHGVDVTAALAVAGMVLALALTRPWGRALPRLPLLALGWAGAGALAPFGIFLAVTGVLAWTGVAEVSIPDHAPWVVMVAYGGFCVYGLALGRATRSYQRATRRTCARC